MAGPLTPLVDPQPSRRRSTRIRPHDGDVEAYRRKLVIYDGRRMEASEPVAFSLFLLTPDGEGHSSLPPKLRSRCHPSCTAQ